MNGDPWQVFLFFGFFIALLVACGLYCVLVTRNLLRAVIGVELLIKAVTLLFIAAGYVTGQLGLAQAFVITIIVVEVVFTVVAGGIALRVFRHIDSLDTRVLTKLKG